MTATLNYIVAATPRTGSSLLCELLESTGIAGRPAEVFAPDFRNPWYQYWSLPQNTNFSEYFRAALMHGTTNNGIYGLKIMWMHIPVLARDINFNGASEDVLDFLFPGAKYVNIIRNDRRAQALSWYRAIETNEWALYAGTEAKQNLKLPLSFNSNSVRSLEAEIDRQQTAWERYFFKRNLETLVVDYETLAADHQSQVARVLAFLDLDIEAAQKIPPPRLLRQSDEISLKWRQQMETESFEAKNDG